MTLLFELQHIIFHKLTQNPSGIQVLKIAKEIPKKKFILIESAKEDKSFYSKREFNFNLNLYPDSFSYETINAMTKEVESLIGENDFCHLSGFVNYKFKNIKISSNRSDGFNGIMEIAIFFTPI